MTPTTPSPPPPTTRPPPGMPIMRPAAANVLDLRRVELRVVAKADHQPCPASGPCRASAPSRPGGGGGGLVHAARSSSIGAAVALDRL